jgi:hypothetical protein
LYNPSQKLLFFQMVGSPVLLSAAVLLAAAKEALSFVPVARKMLRGEHWIELWIPSAGVFCSLFALGFALPNRLPGTTPSDAYTSNKQISGSTMILNLGDVGFYHSQDPRRGLLTLAIPFSKDNPSQKSDEGVKVEGDSVKLVKRIGHALAKCEGENGVKAHIEVVGFASSLGPVERPADYRKIELEVAQRRADNVKGLLEDGARDATTDGHLPIAVDAPLWRSYDEMESEIRFRDLVDERYDEQLGNLTRRAEIRIKNAGRCEVPAPTPTTVEPSGKTQ